MGAMSVAAPEKAKSVCTKPWAALCLDMIMFLGVKPSFGPLRRQSPMAGLVIANRIG
jgi:hypothetical protein